jgi:hypothetical protein
MNHVGNKRAIEKILNRQEYSTANSRRYDEYLNARIHMTVAGTIAYKFLAHATYLHVYTLTGMPVSATQVDSTFDLLACNLREGLRGATIPACVLKT